VRDFDDRQFRPRHTEAVVFDARRVAEGLTAFFLPRLRHMHEATSYDVAVIGGGPAGLSASVWLARYLHRVILIDSGDPRNWETRGVNGYLGLPGIRPSELRGIGR